MADIFTGLSLRNSAGRSLEWGTEDMTKAMLYCRVHYTPEHYCEHRHCDGCCGPRNGCQCPECFEFQRLWVERTEAKCARGHTAVLCTELTMRFMHQNWTETYSARCGTCQRNGSKEYNLFVACAHCGTCVCIECFFRENKERMLQTVPRFNECDDDDCVREKMRSFVCVVGDKKYKLADLGMNDFQLTCGVNGCCGTSVCKMCRDLLATFFGKLRIRCLNGHALQPTIMSCLTKKRGYSSGYLCDKCFLSISDKPNHILVHCQMCHSDICPVCLLGCVYNWEDQLRSFLVHSN